MAQPPAFQSPITPRKPPSHSQTSINVRNSILMEEKMQALRKEAEGLRALLGDKDPHMIVKKHIELLHTYNEIKDGAQALIGRYALMTNRTIKEVHKELELPLID